MAAWGEFWRFSFTRKKFWLAPVILLMTFLAFLSTTLMAPARDGR